MKKVRFNEDNNQIYYMIVWRYAYETARKPFWEIVALDNFRFRTRIKNIERSLSKILNKDHRNTIYDERFA